MVGLRACPLTSLHKGWTTLWGPYPTFWHQKQLKFLWLLKSQWVLFCRHVMDSPHQRLHLDPKNIPYYRTFVMFPRMNYYCHPPANFWFWSFHKVVPPFLHANLWNLWQEWSVPSIAVHWTGRKRDWGGNIEAEMGERSIQGIVICMFGSGPALLLLPPSTGSFQEHSKSEIM